MTDIEDEKTEQIESPQNSADVEKLAAENEALKNEIRMRGAAYEIESRLLAAGARTPGLLAEKAREGFQFAEDGSLTNPGALIDKLKRTYPEQFDRNTPTDSIDAAAGRNSRPPLTREALERMSPEDIRRLDWDEVRAALAG